jgi:hypothetical protein
MLKKKIKATAKRFKTPSVPYNKINQQARTVMVNTFDEVGVTLEKFEQIVDDINVDYRASGWPSDCWPYTPAIERLCVKLNQKYGTSMSCFHIWNTIVAMRKIGVLVRLR